MREKKEKKEEKQEVIENENVDEGENSDTGDEPQVDNSWAKWASDLHDEVKSDIENEENGNRDNAHFCPEFATYLVPDLKLLPLWANIYCHKFGLNGQRAPTSAQIEGEFKKLKNVIFIKEELRL